MRHWNFFEIIVISQKSTKTIIAQEQRHEGMNPFDVFLTPSRSTHHQKMRSKLLEHLNMFPRKSIHVCFLNNFEKKNCFF